MVELVHLRQVCSASAPQVATSEADNDIIRTPLSCAQEPTSTEQVSPAGLQPSSLAVVNDEDGEEFEPLDTRPCMNDWSFFDRPRKVLEQYTAGCVNLGGKYAGKKKKRVVAIVYDAVQLFSFAALIERRPPALTLRHSVAVIIMRLLSFFSLGHYQMSVNDKPGASKPAVPSPLRASFAHKSCNNIGCALILLMLALFGLGSAAGSGPVLTSQTLLPDCYGWLTRHDCPIKAHSWNPDWKNLNKVCCSSFKGTILLCQRGIDELGNSYNFPACIPDVPVPAGCFGKLVKDKEGKPQFLVLPCNASVEYQDRERLSSDVTHPYCRDKSQCDGEGQELLCKNGPTQDDLCMCAEGYQAISPHCTKGFTVHDGCACRKQNCSSGQVPTLTALPLKPRMCPELIHSGFVVQSICTIPDTTLSAHNTTSSPIALLSTTKSPAQKAETPTVPPTATGPKKPPTGEGVDSGLGTAGSVFLGLAIFAMLMYLLCLLLLVVVSRGYFGQD